MNRARETSGVAKRSARVRTGSILGALLAVALGFAANAEAASTSLKIASPGNFSRVAAKKMTVRVHARGPEFRATLDGRDVTSRFRRKGRTLRTAAFRRGRDFRLGRNALTAQVGKPSTRAHKTAIAVFRATARADGRVKVWRQRPSARRSALHLRMRTRKRIAGVRMWVNGKRVRSRLRHGPGARGLTAILGAYDNVRFGRNRVLADIAYRDGKVSRTRRVFRVARNRPLPSAGPDRRLSPRRRIALSAAATRPARRGDRVAYRWKVVSGPKRSGAKLIRPRSARPRFTTKKPGLYRLRLVARDRGAGRGLRVADEAQMTVTPSHDPMGVKVDSFVAGSNGDIEVGPNTYTCPPFTWVHLVVLDGATLSPADGGNQCFFQNQADGLLAALSVSERPNLVNDLVIANGLGLDAGAQDRYAPILTKAFNAVGGTTSTDGPALDGKMPFVQDNWSLIGHVGLSPGEASQSLFQHAVESGHPLNGYLQTVGNKAYRFISPEFARIDTHTAASSATQNVIEVGPSRSGPGGTFPSDVLPGGRSQGFQLVELDPGTMKLIWNETYRTRNANGSVNGSGIRDLAQRLTYLAGNRYFGDERLDMPPLVVLQSFGSSAGAGQQAVGNDESWVNDTVPGWGLSRGPYDGNRYDFFGWCGGSAQTGSLNGYSCAPYPNDPNKLGGNATVTRAIGLIAGLPARTAAANFGLHGAPESLSLVGSPHPYSEDEVSFAVGGNGGRTVATLRRTNQSQWRAAAPAPSDVFDSSAMWELAFAPSTPWPCSPARPAPCFGSAAGLRAAGAYLAAGLWPGQGYGSPRNAYADHIDDKWTSNIETLRGISYSGGSGFGRKAFTRLKSQLIDEFSKLSSVKNMFDQYQKVFATTATNGALLDMQTIGGNIMSAAFHDDAAYQARQVEVRQKDITGGVLYLASDVLDLATFGRTSAVIGVAAGAYDLYQDVTEPDDYAHTGQVPFDEPDRVRDRADLVGADLVRRYQGINDTLDHLLLIFATDWGKLQAADENANGDWSLDRGSDDYYDLVQTSAMGAQAAFYKALMPVAYDQWFVSPSFTYTGSNQGNEYGNGLYYGDHLAMSQPGPTGYQCQPGPPPFAGAPASAVNWVRYTATGSSSDDVGGSQLSSVGRALKSKADPLTLGVGTWTDFPDGTYLFPATQAAGAPPLGPDGKALTDKLFRKPTINSAKSDPDGLAMSKDEFFGLEGWSTPRLQCGRPQYVGADAP